MLREDSTSLYGGEGVSLQTRRLKWNLEHLESC